MSRGRLSLALGLALVAAAALPAGAQRRGGGSDPFANRDEWQRVPEILAAAGAAPGRRIADLAAGKGYLTRPLSRAVGPSGRIYAVEIGEEELRTLAALARLDSFPNVEVVAGTVSDPKLPAGLDAVVILNSYHEFTEYQATLAAILRALRPGGVLVLVDNLAPGGWFTARADQASHHALEPRFVDAELRAAGFEIAARDDGFIVQPFAQWLIVARRPLR